MRVALRGIAFAAIAAIVLTACQAPNNGAKQNRWENQKVTKLATSQWNPQPRDNIRDGGQLNLGLELIPDQLNPWQQAQVTSTSAIWSWYNPVLSSYSPEGDWIYDKNYLVKVDDRTDTGKTQVFYTVRKEAKFNDGTPLDWRAFETAWKSCGELNPQYKCNSTDGYKQIESVTKGVDDKQAVVTFKTIYPWWKSTFSSVLHPAINTPEKFNTAYTKGNVHKEWGAGPFRISTIDAKEGFVTFLPNENWWGEKPKLEKVTLRAFESNAATNAFRNGQLDAVDVATKEFLAQVKDLAGIEIRKGSLRQFQTVMLNSKTPALSDIKVRKALFFAIDRVKIEEVVFNGLEFNELPVGSLLLFPFQKGYKDNLSEVVKFDLDAANKLLDEAGWAKGGDGIRAKDGQKLELRFPTFDDSAVTKARAQVLQAMMQKGLGVSLQIIERPSSDLAKYIHERNFDFVIAGITAFDPFGVATITQLYSATSDFNKTGTGTKELDNQLLAVTKLPTAEEQIRAANDAETAVFREYGWMPISNGITMVACKAGLANYGASVFADAPKQDIGWQNT